MGRAVLGVIVLLRAGVAAVARVAVAAASLSAGTIRATPKEAIIGDARTADVVGRLGGDLEIEALVVEEDPDRGARLGRVEGFDLNAHLLFTEQELVHHYHLAEDSGHVPNDPLRASDVREATNEDPCRAVATALGPWTDSEISTTSLLRSMVMSLLRVP